MITLLVLLSSMLGYNHANITGISTIAFNSGQITNNSSSAISFAPNRTSGLNVPAGARSIGTSNTVLFYNATTDTNPQITGSTSNGNSYNANCWIKLSDIHFVS